MVNRKESVTKYKKEFSANLKKLREDKGLKQIQVAEKLNVAVSTYANWEQGRTEPGVFDIYYLIKIFEIDANDLFDI